jgi:NADH-quinone oxidoreductase subunit M
MTGELHFPWIALSIILPLATAPLVGLVSGKDLNWCLSYLAALVVFAVTLSGWADLQLLGVPEAVDPPGMISGLVCITPFLMDVVNGPLCILSSIVYLAVIAMTPSSKRERFPFGLTLASLGITMALLACRSPLWLTGLLAAQSLLPVFEMTKRKRSVLFYAVHQAVAIGLLAAGVAVTGLAQADSPVALAGHLLMTAGLLVRCGCIPFHCWMVDLVEKASLGTSLVTLTPLTGVCVFLRLVLPVAPDWLLQGIAILSLLTAVYASGMSLVQVCARRYFCYLLLANSSLVMVGLAVLTPIGLTGSLSLWLSAGLSLISLGAVLRAVEGRVGRATLAIYQGLFRQMPLLAAFFLLASLASIGFPGTVGFAGFELLVEGAMRANPLYGTVVVVSMTMCAIGSMRVWFRLFGGAPAPAIISLQPGPSKRIMVWIISCLIIAGGLFPQAGIDTRYEAAGEIARTRKERERGRPDVEEASPAPPIAAISPRR